MTATIRAATAIYDTPPPPGVAESDVDPFTAEHFEDPFPAFDAAREAGEVIWLSRYCLAATGRYDVVRHVLTNWQIFVSSHGVGMEDVLVHGRTRPLSLILEAQPPAHTATRGALTRALSPAVLRLFRETFDQKADLLADELLAARTFDAARDVGREFPLRVFPEAIGIDREIAEKLLPLAEASFNALGPHNELFLKTSRMADFSWAHSQATRDKLKPGRIGMLVHEAEDRGEIPPDSASNLIRALLLAGLDTTIAGIGLCLYNLAKNPSEWAKLKADPKLAKNVFEETTRLESPNQILFRSIGEPTTLCGVPLEPGNKLMLLLAAANRDPRKWEDPARFDINRKTIGHVGFGSGIHACVGQLLARQEGEAILKAIVARAKEIRIVGDPVRIHNNSLRGFSSLPMEIVPE